LFHDALEVYCTWQIGMLNEHVNYYITHSMDPNINYGIHQAPPRVPAFSLVWNELPYIVYWIRYINLGIVNGLKQDIIRRGLPLSPLSMLMVIEQLQRDSHRLLDAVKDRFEMHGLSIDIGKLEVAFISRNTQTSKRFKIDSKRWNVNWGGKLPTIQDTTR
jgi:hypothetical protein